MIRSLPKETFLNINIGMISYVFHRISGIGLCVYLFLHILTLGAVRSGREAFDFSIAKWDNLFGHLMEYLLLMAVVYHTMNGIRIILADFCRMTLLHKRLVLITWIVFFLILALSFNYFFTGL